MQLDESQIFTAYRAARESGLDPDRFLRRHLTQRGLSASDEELADLEARLDKRYAAHLAASLSASPPAAEVAPQAAPLSPPPTAPPSAQEPRLFSHSEDAVTRALVPALSATLQHFQGGTLPEGLADAFTGVAANVRQLRRLVEAKRVSDSKRRSLEELSLDAVLTALPGGVNFSDEAIAEVAKMIARAFDEATRTGPLEEVDEPLIARGLEWFGQRARDLVEANPGNLEARAQRLETRALELQARAQELRQTAARARALKKKG